MTKAIYFCGNGNWELDQAAPNFKQIGNTKNGFSLDDITPELLKEINDNGEQTVIYLSAHGGIRDMKHVIQINHETIIPSQNFLESFSQVKVPLHFHLYSCSIGKLAADLQLAPNIALSNGSFVGIFGSENKAIRLEVSARLMTNSIQNMQLPLYQNTWHVMPIGVCYIAHIQNGKAIQDKIRVDRSYHSILNNKSIVDYRQTQYEQFNNFLQKTNVSQLDLNDLGGDARIQRYKDLWFMQMVTELTGSVAQKKDVADYLSGKEIDKTDLLQHQYRLSGHPSHGNGSLQDYFASWGDNDVIPLLQAIYQVPDQMKGPSN